MARGDRGMRVAEGHGGSPSQGVSALLDHRVARRMIEGLGLPADEELRQSSISFLRRAAPWSGVERVACTEAEVLAAEELPEKAKRENRKLVDDNDRLRKEKKPALVNREIEANNVSGLRERLRRAQQASAAVEVGKSTAEAAVAAAWAEMGAVRSGARVA